MPFALGDAAAVSRWLTHRAKHLGSGIGEVRVTEVAQLSRGVSRETWAIDGIAVTADGERPLALAVRRDHPAGSVIPTALETEYDVYRLLRDTAVPVAAALLYETDPAWQPDGRTAYLRERVEGSWYLPFLAGDDPALDALRIAASKEHLDKLATVHAVDWRACGLGDVLDVPASAADAAAHLVRSTRAMVEELLDEPSPLLAEAAGALLERAPRDAPDLVLCKGTNGHGEEVWREGRIVALSDWELARIGDPAYDLAQVQEMVPEIVRDGRRLWGWPEALAYYRERSGNEVSLERLEWYRSAYGLLQLTYSVHSGAAVRRLGSRAPLRFLWTAYEITHHAERKLAAAAGVPA